MKSKNIIFVIISIVVLLSIISFVIIYNNRIVSTLTIDINPSIEIGLDRKNMVKKVVPINEDAKELITTDLNGLNLDNDVTLITDNAVKKYTKDNTLVILLYSEGNIDNEKVQNIISRKCEEENVVANVSIIDNVTEEDKALASKYNITPAKAAYINSIVDENEEISFDTFIEKPISEIKETKESGKHCEKDYFLEGDHCFKEINRREADYGENCSRGQIEYKGSCYEEKGFEETGKLVCREGLTLEGNECVDRKTAKATPKYECEKGELYKKGDLYKIGIKDREKMVCADKSTGKKPTLRCLKGPHKIINGDCYVGPAPLINGGCPSPDKKVGSGCYSKDPGDQWECPNGSIYHVSQNSVPDVCPDTIKITDAKISGYTCEEEFQLVDQTCIKEDKEAPDPEYKCPSGYTEIEDGRCINLNNKMDKQISYYCKKDTERLEEKTCIDYDITEAIQN